MEDNFDLSKLKRKKRVNSRTKGNRFENKVADILNTRFETKEFCRTPGSGAFATTHKLPEHLKIYGDLITPQSFRFIIECKKGYNKEKICDLFNTKSDISDMIAKAERDSTASSKKYLLILEQDRKSPIVITNSRCMNFSSNALRGYINKHELSITTLDDLLALPDYHFFI